MEFRILCLGDIVGDPPCRVIMDHLPAIRRRERIGFCVANGENLANGSGITERLFQNVRRAGVDVVTMGDHVWKHKEIIATIDNDQTLLRPANLPPEAHGKGSCIVEAENGLRIGVINLLGRLYMNLQADCFFHAVDRELKKIRDKADLVVVELHGEATSEKVALGWYLMDRVEILYGTHTHIPTADARILEGGAAYITDLGMCGAYKSVIGRAIKPVLQNFVTSIPAPFHVATEDVRLCGMIVTFDQDRRKAIAVERFEFKP